MASDRDTIFALSSGRPPAAIAVVRISGPRAGAALKALTDKRPEPRQAVLVRVCDPRTQEPIDVALALWFPAPHSETGEDVAELQLHGGRAVIAATLEALGSVEGLRPAEAGEFTRRAFENDKLDLPAVEGLADLIAAETEGQRRQALRQMQGALGARAEIWRDQLIRALALVEAHIDFSDETDVPEDLLTPALAIARSLAEEIAHMLADSQRGERLREGLVVAIAGPPNAGKSTLINRIARREAAIVSPYAGTTRDVIEVHLNLGGWPVTLLDTAGIRETQDPVEMEGVRRARERAAAADLVLWIVDVDAGEADAGPMPATSGPTVWFIHNKIDLVPQVARNEFQNQNIYRNELEYRINDELRNSVNKKSTTYRKVDESRFTINESEFHLSALTGEGFESLLNHLERTAENYLSGAESALITRARQQRNLEDVLAALQRAFQPALAEDLLAEELRLAARALGRLTGRVDVEEILDVIFRDFCIGK